MRVKRYIFLSLAIAGLFLTGCTHPNGDIGDWFGSWHLESMTVAITEDGVTTVSPDEQYNANPEIMFSFQGKVFNAAYMERAEIYGSWSYAGETLTLIAGYNAGSGASVDYLFNPFPVAMHLPEGIDEQEITVVYINSRTMQWQYIDSDGSLRTCNFKKYP